MSKFDEILNSDKNAQLLLKQAEKRLAYNREYQRRVRARARLLTLEKRIDENIDHVIGYILDKYGDLVTSYKPTEVIESNVCFDNWLLLSGDSYASREDAYQVSTLEGDLGFDEFCKLFDLFFKLDDNNRYIKVKPVE